MRLWPFKRKPKASYPEHLAPPAADPRSSTEEFDYFAYDTPNREYKQFPTEAEATAFIAKLNKNGFPSGFMKIAK